MPAREELPSMTKDELVKAIKKANRKATAKAR